jgi:hypothetical protein
MKKVLLGMFLLSPAMLWAQDDVVLASALPEIKSEESVITPAPPPTAVPVTAPVAVAAKPAPALIAVAGKPVSDAAAYVSFVEGRADCRMGMMAIAVKNVSDKPMVVVVEKAMYYSYHNMTAKDVRIDNLGAGEVRTIGCKGSVETATGDTHSTIKLKAAMFK